MWIAVSQVHSSNFGNVTHMGKSKLKGKTQAYANGLQYALTHADFHNATFKATGSYRKHWFKSLWSKGVFASEIF